MKKNIEPGRDHAGLQKPKSSRKGVPKSKTGCTTCRIRRLKCDETKPACARCTTTKRTCDFLHPAQVQPRTPPKARSKVLLPIQKVALRPKLAPALCGPVTSDEAPHFSFFLAICTRSLSRHFGDPLWTYLVLQMAHSEPPIRHAVLSLAILIRSQHLPPERRALERRNSQVRYLHALQTLNRRLDISAHSWELALVVSLLFTSYVVLRGHLHDGESLGHFTSGQAMLKQCPSQAHVRIALSFSTLNSSLDPIISTNQKAGKYQHNDPRAVQSPSRFDTQAWTLGATSPSHSALEPLVPPKFNTIRYARDTLDSIINYAYRL
ncbi:hypothetical protein N431DRAFT_460758 [Stipitochalara longipes BDJ]|nr:hypothetical protein N431DRAFT_460758 [Stipitochalara longipes BDJ]